MDQKILDFLTRNKVAVLTTLLKDGTPHSAVIHYSFTENPFVIYMSTEDNSRKCEALNNGEVGKASFVLGFSEEEWISFQAEGTVEKVTNNEELAKIEEAHYAKHPNSAKFKGNPHSCFLAFKPTWWRYSEFMTHPPTFISSK